MPAIHVKPFVKGQKNDDNDGAATAEAAVRPNLRVIPGEEPKIIWNRRVVIASRPVPAVWCRNRDQTMRRYFFFAA